MIFLFLTSPKRFSPTNVTHLNISNENFFIINFLNKALNSIANRPDYSLVFVHTSVSSVQFTREICTVMVNNWEKHANEWVKNLLLSPDIGCPSNQAYNNHENTVQPKKSHKKLQYGCQYDRRILRWAIPPMFFKSNGLILATQRWIIPNQLGTSFTFVCSELDSGTLK